MTNDDVLAQLDRSWANLTAAIDGIPANRLSEPGVTGQWSVKDLLGHVAFWDRFGAARAERALAGLPKPAGETDWQTLNDTDQAAKADWEPARILAELRAAHSAIMTAYQALSILDPDHVKEDWEHYDEHAAEIRTWRDRLGI